MHSGLGTVLVSNHYQYPCALDHCSYHCVWWEKIFSNVPPALFGQAFSNLQKIRLEGAGLSVDQLNTFCTVIASDATTKEYLELDDNRLWDVQPSLLAQAVIKFRLVILDRGWKRCAKNFVAHGVALFNALGESSSCTSHLSLTGFDLSGVDPGVMAKQVLKLRVCYLNTAGLTTEQSSAITNAVSDDNSNLYHLKINCGSNTRTQLIFAVGNFIRELNIDTWRLWIIAQPLCLKISNNIQKLCCLTDESSDFVCKGSGLTIQPAQYCDKGYPNTEINININIIQRQHVQNNKVWLLCPVSYQSE